MNTIAQKNIALSLVIGLVLSEISPAWAAGPGIQLSPAHATLKERYEAGPKRIIHIQDAHANYSAQSHLAAALDEIMDKTKVSLVLVEGGSIDGTLEPLKAVTTPAQCKRAAKSLLLEGRISGEEYLNLVSARPMKIRGIEDLPLYEKSVRDYARVATMRERALASLSRVDRALAALKKRAYPPQIWDYEQAGRMTAGGFKKLMAAAGTARIEGALFPNMKRLHDVFTKETAIDFDRASAGELAQLARYREYKEMFAKVDMRAAILEWEMLENAVFDSFVTSEEGRAIRQFDRYYSAVDRAVRILASPADIQTLAAWTRPFAADAAFINRKLIEAGRFDDVIPSDTALEEIRGPLNAFYATVAERDIAFLKNAERIMDEEKQKTAVLIAGGYHTERLKELMKVRRFSYEVIAPIVERETDQSRYEQLLLGRGAPDTHVRTGGEDTVRMLMAAQNAERPIERLFAAKTAADGDAWVAAAQIFMNRRAGARLASSQGPEGPQEFREELTRTLRDLLSTRNDAPWVLAPATVSEGGRSYPLWSDETAKAFGGISADRVDAVVTEILEFLHQSKLHKLGDSYTMSTPWDPESGDAPLVIKIHRNPDYIHRLHDWIRGLNRYAPGAKIVLDWIEAIVRRDDTTIRRLRGHVRTVIGTVSVDPYQGTLLKSFDQFEDSLKMMPTDALREAIRIKRDEWASAVIGIDQSTFPIYAPDMFHLFNASRVRGAGQTYDEFFSDLRFELGGYIISQIMAHIENDRLLGYIVFFSVYRSTTLEVSSFAFVEGSEGDRSRHTLLEELKRAARADGLGFSDISFDGRKIPIREGARLATSAVDEDSVAQLARYFIAQGAQTARVNHSFPFWLQAEPVIVEFGPSGARLSTLGGAALSSVVFTGKAIEAARSANTRDLAVTQPDADAQAATAVSVARRIDRQAVKLFLARYLALLNDDKHVILSQTVGSDDSEMRLRRAAALSVKRLLGTKAKLVHFEYTDEKGNVLPALSENTAGLKTGQYERVFIAEPTQAVLDQAYQKAGLVALPQKVEGKPGLIPFEAAFLAAIMVANSDSFDDRLARVLNTMIRRESADKLSASDYRDLKLVRTRSVERYLRLAILAIPVDSEAYFRAVEASIRSINTAA